MLQRTEGVVLRSFQYGEADLIVTYLTRDFGLMKVFAKSPRKTKSRFGSSLEPLTCSHISFWGKEEASLPRLTQADIIHAFTGIRESLGSFLNVAALIELTLQIVPERDSGKGIYTLFMQTLAFMEKGGGYPVGGLFYKLKLLELSGFLPGFQSCGRCGRKGDGFHLSHGTVLCDKCSSDDSCSNRLSPAVKAFFASLIKWEPAKLERLKPSDQILNELTLLIDEHVRYITGKNAGAKGYPAK